MNLEELKKQHVRQTLGIIADDFPDTISFIDFANVNKWYEEDEFSEDGVLLNHNQRLSINLEGLRDFLKLFSIDSRFYYGTDPANDGSVKFMGAARYVFGDRRVFTKPVQKIKHHIGDIDPHCVTRAIKSDASGNYVIIPKSNFDVEITLDSIRLSEKYKTICLLSGDADFAPLLRYLKGLGKRTIIIKGGFIQDNLRQFADLIINAQDIKQYIAVKKQKPDQ
ncbi:MAG: hypothetical protein A3A96_02765 [Candidatus Zambryskibacteria bacterium RIFCSPLOWO2_01_FULL_39_39]|uniref:NYN domain-containing protein n=1 Tax=Candidatus Zambryskibacteria bacterium RIFCSPLOWO2_01_FULL_39_39 TaxID=1802758 RepID=A0A1G2TY73_9BACT|nr:MAG: hypothetical protein UT00_C0002G0067 [Parcubacteria group bacterium GW2011_GWA1_38_7]OHA86911.1 MAG: hypothetical protein A2644_00330 [Candidatus Zambryskibacteria bacterium RIFCSPHIGHO2_01_FULL_39_63]OHA94476.1 MAG: hypothetical protein A3B88_02150 [Candidatus Zambryskibacteria bacterium RIFCSPHIGHO2_02_FULL_39_19]OHA99007.1 MAG: hypothetical protein A3F20_00475 [Candidatus Zambryskibacteria bacterium RIFCSPHIGHO2_12_FULL_39_21]OHB01570.1 MAG: hypothetical protein A3A96_02765 [Candidat